MREREREREKERERMHTRGLDREEGESYSDAWKFGQPRWNVYCARVGFLRALVEPREFAESSSGSESLENL